jgi:limonene-1,2-epoxide hydrolase
MTTALPPIVETFLAAIGRRDTAAAARCLAQDVQYHFLVPTPPVLGRAEVEAVLTKLIDAAAAVEWEITAAATRGRLTFTERVDRFRFHNGAEAHIECMGVFEVRDGLIAQVRDYADMSTWQARKSAALAESA